MIAKQTPVAKRQVCFEIVGYLLEELRDSNNFEAFKKDVSESNVFIGSLIFIEELADKVRIITFETCMRTPCCTRSYCCMFLSVDRLKHGAYAPPCMQIVEAVQPMRERLDACLIFPSMPAVMKLNKLGTFSMSQLGQSKSIIGDFIKSARQVSPDTA